MPNAIDDVVINGAPINGGDALNLATASVEELCISAEAVWEITLEADVEEC